MNEGMYYKDSFLSNNHGFPYYPSPLLPPPGSPHKADLSLNNFNFWGNRGVVSIEGGL